MGFNIEQATELVNQFSHKIAVDALMKAPTIANLIKSANVQSGLKPGNHEIRKMSQTVTFASGKGCGRNPTDTVTLSDQTMEVVAMKSELNLCSDDLYGVLRAGMLSRGQNPETEFENAFLNFIETNRSEKIGVELEKLAWKGDKTLTGTNNLKWANGFVKQATAGGAGTYIALTTSKTDLIEKLQDYWLAMPSEIKDQADFKIFMGTDIYNQYLVAAANKNYFNPSSPFNLYGTSAVIEPTPGLNGTNKLFFMTYSNLQFGFDGDNETEKMVYKYSIETQNHYLDYFFALGFGIVNTKEIGVATLS